MFARSASTMSRLGPAPFRRFPVVVARHMSSAENPQAAGGAAGGAASPNPLSPLLDHLPAPILEAAKKLQQEAVSGAEAARQMSEDAAGKLPGQLPNLPHLKNLAEPNLEALSKNVLPLFSAFLVIARNGKLSDDHRSLLAEVLPPAVEEMFQKVSEVVPEDPQVVELRRVAAALEDLNVRLAAQVAPETSSSGEAPAATVPVETPQVEVSPSKPSGSGDALPAEAPGVDKK